MRCRMNKLGRKSFKHRGNTTHSAHSEHTEASKLYDHTLEHTKCQHWRDWLEKAVDPDIWTVHKVISTPTSDGAKAKILALKYKQGDEELTASTNTEKAQVLAKSFFPTKPAITEHPPDDVYPQQCCNADPITKDQIAQQLKRLKLYKAPGPDSIPNIVLTKCVDLLINQLHNIYKVMVTRNLHYPLWKTSTMVVLRKPGKPRYDILKAYCPIALLNTMWKVLSAVLADQLTYYSEKHQLLPSHHFGGRPGRTTTDAIHLLMYRIKSEWRQGNVVSVLFLDIEGAFPNVVPERLVHNLHKRHIPKRYTEFLAGMLEDRTTYLKFDDHSSEAISINNGIGQGNPLSMVLYQYYNADILDIPSQANEIVIDLTNEDSSSDDEEL